ncbi:MAG TPA: hypothetical protein VGG10_22600 [Rhizomicrobium sp.]
MLALSTAARAQDLGSGFSDTGNGGKLHVASHFLCPDKIGLFERDAVGEKDADSGADFCAYSALDGTYGTITLSKLSGAYDAKAALVSDFAEQEGIGAQKLGEATVKAGPLPVYTRTYETSKIESMHYSILFSGAAVGDWVVETTIEYANPRDNAAEKEFLDTVYADALKQIPAVPVSSVTPTPPVETPPAPALKPVPGPAAPKH